MGAIVVARKDGDEVGDGLGLELEIVGETVGEAAVG